MIETSVFTVLDTALSCKVWPLVIPEKESDLPVVVYQRISGVPENSLDGYSISKVRIQVDVYAESYNGAKTLAESVKTAMLGASFKCTLDADRDRYIDDSELFNVSMDFMCWQRED